MTGDRTWVLGASSGIGAALATELVRRGSTVAISGRRLAELQQVSGGQLHVQPCDAVELADVRTAADQVTAALGGLDVAVYSAGVFRQVEVDRWDVSTIRQHLEVHVLGLANMIDAVLPGMLARKHGCIVGISSVAGYRGLPKAEAYAAAKAAQQILLESLRADVAARGVRVVTVCPGFVSTEMTAGNEFSMPWMVQPDEAARRIADGLAKGSPEIVFPVPMMIAMKLARIVPVRAWSSVTSLMARRARRPARP